MSAAHERLTKLIADYVPGEGDRCVCGSPACDKPADLANEILAQHAHELAEQIRARGNAAMETADADGGRTTPDDPKYDKAATWYTAADLIDPEAQR